MENGWGNSDREDKGQNLIWASVDVGCVFSSQRWWRGRRSPHFMETLLVWKVHCSTPWISRWVTFWDTPTWRTPCCWAVHKHRTLLTPSSQELNCVFHNVCRSSSKRNLFPLSKMVARFPPLHQNMLFLWVLLKSVSQCTIKRLIFIKAN